MDKFKLISLTQEQYQEITDVSTKKINDAIISVRFGLDKTIEGQEEYIRRLENEAKKLRTDLDYANSQLEENWSETVVNKDLEIGNLKKELYDTKRLVRALKDIIGAIKTNWIGWIKFRRFFSFNANSWKYTMLFYSEKSIEELTKEFL